MSTLLLEFVDRKKVTLDTKLSAYFPGLPRADRVRLRHLAQMTSGYADYVYQPKCLWASTDTPSASGLPRN